MTSANERCGVNRCADNAVCDIQIRITYADTDQMGMVYYANYLTFFEKGRTEWLRNKGFTYREIEAEGIYLPVIECSCKYIAPARYDDLITVRTRISRLGPASVEFGYEIVANGRVITTGVTKHPFVNRDLKPVRMPVKIRELFNAKEDTHR